MFFFFVGGLEQQVRHVVKTGAAKCINCGSNSNLVSYDNVLKVFFVPVWKWPGKHQLLHCPNCNLFYPPSLSLPPPTADATRCYSCSRVVEPEFKFCPFCGVSL